MNKYERSMTLGFMVFGAIFLIGGIHYKIGRFNSPGGGFLPFWFGLILVTLGGAHLISNWKELRKKEEKFFDKRSGMKKMVFTFISLPAYTFLLSWLGFIITTFLFMLFLLRFIEPQKWKVVLIVSIMTTIVAYAFFVLWLRASLPPGILEKFLPY